MKGLVEVLKEELGLGPISFFYVFPVDLDDAGEAVDDELLEEGAVGDGVALGLNEEGFQVGKILKFGNLEQGHDVILVELQNLQFSKLFQSV